MSISDRLILATGHLRRAVDRLEFGPPVSHVYNPLSYASSPYEAYLRKFANGRKRIVFLGMNPGPFGMVQTGVPFGEIAAVRDWLGIRGFVGKPCPEHPRRVVAGFACGRSEVSGRRLWGLFASRARSPARFFLEHVVMNYCPLAFLERSGRNRTPDKLPASERAALFDACDEHLRAIVTLLRPEWVVGVGDFAFRRAAAVFQKDAPRLGRILHPSPANPTANRSWATLAAGQLIALGVWPRRPYHARIRSRSLA